MKKQYTASDISNIYYSGCYGIGSDKIVLDVIREAEELCKVNTTTMYYAIREVFAKV